MPSKSPTKAFDPSPALEHSKSSFFNGGYNHSMMDIQQQSQANGGKVRFEAPVYNSSLRPRHSIATSDVPLLPPIPSASHIPKQTFQTTNTAPGVDISAYFEHCRNVNEQQRMAYEQERKAWEIERMSLKTRVADLEFALNKAGGGRRRLSNDSSYASATSYKSDFQIPGPNGTRHLSICNAPLSYVRDAHSKPIWEPASPSPATRVFSHDDDVQHLPSISEDGPVNMLSPQRSNENKPIPIQQIDETLDGITVRSEGVRSSFNKILSPIMMARSPSPLERIPEPSKMFLDPSSLLDPLDAKLKRNAGHTPLAFDGVLSSAGTTNTGTTPQSERPVAPAPTARPSLRPSENSQSYFNAEDIHALASGTIPEEDEEEEDEPESQYETEEDPSLSGPLMLDASGKSQASHYFLDQLDHRLEEEVRKSTTNSPVQSPTTSQQSVKTEDENFPSLRMKKSTNFGSAYGAKAPGTRDWS